MTPIFPSNRRSPSPTSDRSSSPWTNIEDLDEDLSVIDVQHNLPILHNLAITVNPSISCTLNDFPLIVDLRLSVDRIWKRPQPGWDANVEPFTGMEVSTHDISSHADRHFLRSPRTRYDACTQHDLSVVAAL